MTDTQPPPTRGARATDPEVQAMLERYTSRIDELDRLVDEAVSRAKAHAEGYASHTRPVDRAYHLERQQGELATAVRLCRRIELLHEIVDDMRRLAGSGAEARR